MSKVIVDTPATIINGKLAGHTGNVIGIFSLENQVEIALDDFTSVITSSDNIEQ